MSARGWGSHSQTESHTKPPQGEKQGEWNITINLPTKPHTNPWSSPHRKSVFLMRSSITYPNRWVQSSEDPPNGRWSSGGSQRWWIYGARASHIASNQWAFITSSNTRNNLQSCGKRNGLPWKNTKHRELRSIARWSGWWHPWAISRPSWCSEKWVNEVDHTIQSLRCREAWRPISSRAESHTKPQKGEKQGALIVSPSISRQTSHTPPRHEGTVLVASGDQSERSTKRGPVTILTCRKTLNPWSKPDHTAIPWGHNLSASMTTNTDQITFSGLYRTRWQLQSREDKLWRPDPGSQVRSMLYLSIRGSTTTTRSR